MDEKTAEQIVKEKWPDAYCFKDDAEGWVSFVIITKAQKKLSLWGDSPQDAWQDAAARIQKGQSK